MLEARLVMADAKWAPGEALRWFTLVIKPRARTTSGAIGVDKRRFPG